MKFRLSLILITIFLSARLYGQGDRLSMLKEFAATKEDSLFITKYSKWPYQKFVLQAYSFPQSFSPIDSLIFHHGNTGKIIGPVNIDSLLIYIKVIAVDSLLRMRVGNIWLSPEKRGQENIDKLAEDILGTVIGTGDFDSLYKEYSDDPKFNFEADLGWFFQGSMVDEFEKEVLKHKKGDYYVVSSRFGKHIVKTIEDPVFDRSKVEYVLLYLDKK